MDIRHRFDDVVECDNCGNITILEVLDTHFDRYEQYNCTCGHEVKRSIHKEWRGCENVKVCTKHRCEFYSTEAGMCYGKYIHKKGR